MDGHLRRLGLFERFDAVICEEDVEKIKPAPDLFLKAAATLGVAPAEAVGLEDSPHSLAAAASAGMFSVAVPNELTATWIPRRPICGSRRWGICRWSGCKRP